MKLKPVSSDKIIKTLAKLGFEKIRQKGSHLFLRHADGRTTVVPIHRGEEIGRGLLMKIIRDTKMEKEEFLKILEEM